MCPGQPTHFYISHHCRTDQRLTAQVTLVDVLEMPGLDEEKEEEIPTPSSC